MGGEVFCLVEPDAAVADVREWFMDFQVGGESGPFHKPEAALFTFMRLQVIVTALMWKLCY